MGGQGSLMHMGSEGWLVWSDPTDELLLHKLLKKLMQVLIEREQPPRGLSMSGGHIIMAHQLKLNPRSELLVIQRTVYCCQNNEPWITSDLKDLLNKKKDAFRFSTGSSSGPSHTGTVFTPSQTPKTHLQQHHTGLLTIPDYNPPNLTSTGLTTSSYLTLTANQSDLKKYM
ncbi:hypothetical protein QTP70_004374 [Hemibagrus guttatus]|uniref:Uncharacterized protein n=1 Tax=Hemibagrus guttatus TaxID=175788 RepID=A0AAE0RHD5_9TELE|nr:hypothetical protein QTP70_004374 [Hemibagrus guttatus]